MRTLASSLGLFTLAVCWASPAHAGITAEKAVQRLADRILRHSSTRIHAAELRALAPLSLARRLDLLTQVAGFRVHEVSRVVDGNKTTVLKVTAPAAKRLYLGQLFQAVMSPGAVGVQGKLGADATYALSCHVFSNDGWLSRGKIAGYAGFSRCDLSNAVESSDTVGFLRARKAAVRTLASAGQPLLVEVSRDLMRYPTTCRDTDMRKADGLQDGQPSLLRFYHLGVMKKDNPFRMYRNGQLAEAERYVDYGQTW